MTIKLLKWRHLHSTCFLEPPGFSHGEAQDTELTEEFLRAFAFNADITLHVNVLYGRNSHHKIEAIFKALGHALRIATEHDPRMNDIPSTKGVL